MGLKFSRLIKPLVAKRNIKILMLGLDDSGKTTILYKLKLGGFVATVPTIDIDLDFPSLLFILFDDSIFPYDKMGWIYIYEGFNVEGLEYKNISFSVWDLGGQDTIRALWRHYYRNTQALIFVVDSNNRQRIHEARNELHHLLNEDELSNATILVFANKVDLPHAMHVSEVACKLELHTISQRPWYIQSTSATTGQGLYEGLIWLTNNIPNKVAQTTSCISLPTRRL